ncbi:MAG TPA: hypothetical protein VJH20_02320 [Candidatus Nanoarchaeia archaeon]|nr:hypothetical protein [Candidatus Nanoarchaeia archaeon]
MQRGKLDIGLISLILVNKCVDFVPTIGKTILGVYLTFYLGCTLREGIKKPFPLSEEQLEVIVKEEKDKLNMQEEVTLLVSEPLAAQSCKVDGRYFIELGGRARDRDTVRHELYHIYKRHVDKEFDPIRYFMLQEPQAIFYEYFNIKI